MRFPATMFVLAALLGASGAAYAAVPEPDVIYYGAANTTETIRLFDKNDKDLTTPLAEYQPEEAADGSPYVLRAPMGGSNLKENGQAEIYIGDIAVQTVKLPAPGAVVKLDLDAPPMGLPPGGGDPPGAGDPTDADEDGLPDDWEMAAFGDLRYGPEDDPDNDGFTNLQEYENNTRPGFPDVEECLTDAAGHLDLTDAAGVPDARIDVSAQINEAPNGVADFSFDVTFDPMVLLYENATPGALAADFAAFETTPTGDGATVRVSGFFNPEDAIPAGASGELARLHFRVVSDADSALGLINLSGDLSDDWIFSGACFTAGGCNGDVNGDGDVTPADALAIFEKIQGVCPTTAGLACDDLCADVNNDGQTTPADALCVFNKAIEILDCLD